MNITSDRKPVDKFIPWMFVLFFLTFITVDAVMVTLAVRTQTGVVTEQAYEKGLAYNETLRAAAMQKSWGWKDRINLNDDSLIFSLQDKNGVPVTNALVTAQFVRPIQDGYDFSVPLSPDRNNHYQAAVKFPMKGEWNVRVNAKWQNKSYQSVQTFIIP